MLHVNIIKVNTPEEMGRKAADLFEAVIQVKPACVMGRARNNLLRLPHFHVCLCF